DLAALPLGGATAVLSACETGVRGVVAGDEVLGLVRGLCRSGASTVLASLWRVDDRATHSLMTDFYSRWPRLECLGAAWREAPRRAASETQDAYQWAAFCRVGEPGARCAARATRVPGGRNHKHHGHSRIVGQ